MGLLLAGAAAGQEFTAVAVEPDGTILFTTAAADGTSTLTSVDSTTFATTETSLDFRVVDLEKKLSFGSVAASLDGLVQFLDTGATYTAPVDELHAVAFSLTTSAFGNTTELAVCDAAGAACEFIQVDAPITDLSFLGDLLVVVSGGEAGFYDGTTQVATLTTGVDTVDVLNFRTADGGEVGIGIGPCNIVDAALTDEGILIPDAGVRMVTTDDLPDGVDPLARARQGVLLGTLFSTDLAGDLVIDEDTGEIVGDDGAVVGELTAVSIFPTAVRVFDFGSPVVALSCGGSAIMVDLDGAGPGAAEVLSGDVVHCADVDITPPHMKRRSNGTITAHVEIPGSFVGRVDVSSVALAGVAASRAGGVEDEDDDGEPDRPFKFARSALAAVLPNGTSTVDLTGTVDGVPFSGKATIEIRP